MVVDNSYAINRFIDVRTCMYEQNILSVSLDDITIITQATCGSASFFFNVETRDPDIAIHHRDRLCESESC